MSTLILRTARPAQPEEPNRDSTEIPVELGAGHTGVARAHGTAAPGREVVPRAHGTTVREQHPVTSHRGTALCHRETSSAHLLPRPLSADDPDLGASTAEYAVIVLAAAAFGGVMAAVLSSDTVSGLLLGMIQKALSF